MVPGPGSCVPSTVEISAPLHMPCATTLWNMSLLANASSRWVGLMSPDMIANSSMSLWVSVRTLTHKDIGLFAVMSGDINPTHLDDAFAKSDMYHKVVAHGMWSGALISTLLGTQLPGPGTVYVDQSLHFQR